MREIKYILLVGMVCGLISCGTITDFVSKPAPSARNSSREQSGGDATSGARQTGNDRAMQRFFNKKKNDKAEEPAVEKAVEERASKPVNAPDKSGTKAPLPAAEVKASPKSAECRAIAEHINGEWMFDNAWGKSVPGEDDRPSIIFEASKGRFYAFNGCNYLNGDYEIVSKDEIRLSNVISTQMYCADDTQSSELTAMLNQARYFKITALKAEEYLEVMNDRRQKIGTIHRHCLEALNGMWEVESIGKTRVDHKCPPTLVIDLLEKRVHGHTGCNLFNGTIYQDPDKDVSVQFQDMKVTKMNCPTVDVETAMLVALERVERVQLDGDTRAMLCDADGNVLITLIRTEL